MQSQSMNFNLAHWVSSLTQQAVEKNLSVPNCVVVVVKGIAINGERRFAGHVERSHKSLFNCGF